MNSPTKADQTKNRISIPSDSLVALSLFAFVRDHLAAGMGMADHTYFTDSQT
jgi:hypothetical protein